MGRSLLKGWLLFVLCLALAAYIGIRITAPEDPNVLPLPRSSEPPKDNPMILVPAGTFVMGSEEGGYDERPVTQIFVPAFEISRYETTQHQYAEFVKATRHRSALSRYVKNIEQFNHPDQPVVYVTWEDAQAFCRWQGKRLPTETEWEKAARGTQGAAFPWGDKTDAMRANVIGPEDGHTYTAIVGAVAEDRSPFGLYDMAGNVREWVSDWYDASYYQTGPQRSLKGPDIKRLSGEQVKVLRGGSWNDGLPSGRTTSRIKMFPNYRDTTTGFRCAKDAD